METQTDFEAWIPVRRVSARPRGHGYPHAVWIRSENNEAHHLSGHHEDYLFLRSPLRGNFEIAGEMGNEATTQLLAAGKYFGPRWKLGEFETGLFRQGHAIETISPPFSKFDSWVRFRAVFRDRLRTIYINGRAVHTEPLPERHDPWIGVRAWSRAVARLRNVQIAGHPQIPDRVLISASDDLLGWVPYYDESAGKEGAIWRHADDSEGAAQIHGRRRPELMGTCCESLLGYHRPLAEDGTIEYEFFYEPGAIDAHPALDRRAFLLEPTGVRLHWITDGRYDRTGVPPDNVFDEPQNRRGPATLPLKASDWNQLKLSLAGDTVALRLNGQLICERTLEPTNLRTFGLFHFADQTELRVRNVVMRGDWPSTLPPPGDMELGDPVAEMLDTDLSRMKAVFTHDFAKDGLPEEYFQFGMSPGRGEVTPRRDGVLAARAGADNWPTSFLKLPFSALGDFDVEASFRVLKLDSEEDAVLLLQANLNDRQQHQCRLLRGRNGANYQRIEQSLSMLNPTRGRSYKGNPVACEAMAGTLRIARRGDTVYYLFAEEDSRAFQCVGTDVLNDAPMKQPGIELHALCHGAGETQVVWKTISLRAEQLKYMPLNAQPERGLHVMNADGGSLRRLTGPLPGFTHLGSPEWSSDGDSLVLDMSQGSTTSSHIVVIDSDGSHLRDLGLGCMPSFSRDGKRIVFSQPGRGVVTMNSDGSKREVLDRGGWGAQWCPNGSRIAYGKSGNITVVNVNSGEQQLLLTGEEAARYSLVYWNLGWSHDSRWIAFKARNRQTGTDEMAVAGLGPEDKFQVLHADAGEIHPDFTWSPDDRRVLFAMNAPALKSTKLFWIDRTAPKPPELLPDQPPDQRLLNCAWSPDGRHIAFTSESMVQPLEWPVADP